MTIKFGFTVNPDLITLPLRAPKVNPHHIDEFDWMKYQKQLASVTPRYREGSFTGTIPGATNATGTIEYRIIGFIAFISIPSNITGAGSTTGFTVTGVPDILVTKTSYRVVAPLCEDNSVITNITNMVTGTSNTWTFGKALTGGVASWTAANTKGLIAQSGFWFPLS